MEKCENREKNASKYFPPFVHERMKKVELYQRGQLECKWNFRGESQFSLSFLLLHPTDFSTSTRVTKIYPVLSGGRNELCFQNPIQDLGINPENLIILLQERFGESLLSTWWDSVDPITDKIILIY